VTIIKDHIRDLWEHSKAALEANYAGLPTYPETFDGYMALTNPAAAEIAASNLLMKTIANERLGQPIFGMHWTRHDLKNSKFRLLTSDRPIIMPLGLGDPRAYIALPVSPTVLFVAAHDPAFARSLAGLKQTELVWVSRRWSPRRGSSCGRPTIRSLSSFAATSARRRIEPSSPRRKSKSPWPQRAASCRAAQLFIHASHGRLRPN
jgi:hypothetical protein